MEPGNTSSGYRAYVPLLVGVLPIIAINASYLTAAFEGYVPWCVPYWEGCTSISATGREGAAFFLFKATMLPLALLYIVYWRQAWLQLILLGYTGRSVVLLGTLAALALMVYTLVLGAVGDSFQLTRRIGIILFFTFTYLAQLLSIYELGKRRPEVIGRVAQLRLCTLILMLGLLSLVLDVVLPNYDDFEDSFEWVLALLIQVNFIISHWTWQHLRR